MKIYLDRTKTTICYSFSENAKKSSIIGFLGGKVSEQFLGDIVVVSLLIICPETS